MLAGRILAEALAMERAHVTQSASYGPESRGSDCRADVVASDEFIAYPRATAPDFLITLSQNAYDKFTRDLKTGATVIFDAGLVKPSYLRGIEQFGIEATGIAEKKFGNAQNANLVILGALGKISGAASKESLADACLELGFNTGPAAIEHGWEAAAK